VGEQRTSTARNENCRKSAEKKLSSIRDLKRKCVNAPSGSHKLRLGVAQKDECEEGVFGHRKGNTYALYLTVTLVQG